MSDQFVARRDPSLFEVIDRLVSMPASEGLDRVEILERLVAMKERQDSQSRKEAFAAAMSALQAELPQIDKGGRIIVQGQTRSTYARVEDIDTQIRPYLAKHGFSFSWDTQASPKNEEIRYVGTMTHSAGHHEDKAVDLPIEDELSSQGKLLMTKVQKRGATLSYAIRTLLRMHLNLITRDADTDGTSVETVSAKDLDVIKGLLESTGSDHKKFLEYMRVEALEDIQRRDVSKAMSALKAKAGKKAE